MEIELLARWLESLGLVPANVQDLLPLFQNGLLAQTLTKHFTNRKIALSETGLNNPDRQRQNWQRVLREHNFKTVLPADGPSLQFLQNFLTEAFERYVLQPVSLSEEAMLQFIHQVIRLGELVPRSSSLQTMYCDVIEQPFVPLLAQMLYPGGDILQNCTAKPEGDTRKILKNMKVALPVLLHQGLTALLRPDELANSPDWRFLAYQLFVWQQEAEPRLANRVLKPLKFPIEQQVSQLKQPTQSTAQNDSALTFDDVALSYGFVDELCQFVVAPEKLSLVKYEEPDNDIPDALPEIPDLPAIALKGNQGYMNPLDLAPEEIDTLQLDKNTLILISKGICFKNLYGTNTIRLSFLNGETALQVGQAIAAILKSRQK